MHTLNENDLTKLSSSGNDCQVIDINPKCRNFVKAVLNDVFVTFLALVCLDWPP